LQTLPPARDGEHLERPGEVQDFDVIEEHDRNAADGHAGILLREQ
jgi:hypothetical protein